ncbi:hypothetical protein [Pseudomonas sp. MPR-ANC1]|uniref:hypothetical protein n=1 Tax=Pseudomonas sp. MPR-ANC1 TaxID=2075548 RepID=UPI0011AFA1DB|nr:hypothetical protein [Pseudomonas sp. MPR-ANC1]
MAIPVIAALLLHVIWLARRYQHATPSVMKRVRTLAAVTSLTLTTVLFCLIQNNVSQLAHRNIYFQVGSASGQATPVTSSPDNSICYTESSNLDDNGK